jgi:uncharacterized membrane protein
MAYTALDATHGSDVALPTVRKIGLSDLKQALVEGIGDFRAMPSHVIFLALIYPLVGLALGKLMFRYEVLPLLYPLVTGFALIGPFAAIGLYELSRRRELGLDTEWQHAFDVLRSPSALPIFGLGALFAFLLIVWLAAADTIYARTMGNQPIASFADLMHRVFATKAGWTLIIAGNAVGFLFAVAVLTLGVVSFPLLLDRNVGGAVAILTSIRAVITNPFTMAAWGFIVAAALVVGSIPFLLGLAVVMPVLGHATWHLYRRVVA